MQSHAPGSVVGGFRLEEKIHTGGMATIWRVIREDLALPMVMKIPRLLGGDDPSGVISFEVEQMILPKLSGKHVPRFIAAGDFSSQPYLVMELIPGSSLESLLENAPLPAEEVANIGVKAATALHDIHRQHVLHLDVTPDNIVFRKSGEAVFIDFGLSRHDQLPDLMAEVYCLPMGTAPYIAPEQVLQVRNDLRSDIFSLGVILYELITGELPYGSPNSMAGTGPPSAISVTRHLVTMPIIMAAVDTSPGMEALADTLRQAATRIFYSEKNARLTCVTIRKTPLVGLDPGVDEEGNSLHVRSLVQLKHWARPLEIPADRISFHVIEAPDPAAALVNYAKANHVDHIVIGARGNSTLRWFMGSVSSQVVAQAPCWVTVVRIPHDNTSRNDSTGYSGHG